MLKNKGTLAKAGICIPGPGRYRKSVIREAQKLRGIPADSDFRDLLVASIIDDDHASRLVLTIENLLCVHSRVFENGIIYDQASTRPANLRKLFPGLPVEFFLSVRNPATFIPAVFHHKNQSTPEFLSFMDKVEPDKILWSDVISALTDSNPGCRVTVWCNEDTPLIWPEVMTLITGFETAANLEGGNDVLASIMRNEGLARMQTYLGTHPPRNEHQRRQIALAFLDKYAIDDAIEEVLDVPGWTDDLVEELTLNYEADLHKIAQMDQVRFISA
ncbi:MAG: hypothetical protein V3U96_10600 [Paracoccaceae bacterium]